MSTRGNMKNANWKPCSDASIHSELSHLKEVRTNLSECVAVLAEDEPRTNITMALSFVQMAIDALATFQVKATTATASR